MEGCLRRAQYTVYSSNHNSSNHHNNITLNTLRISMYNSKSFRELGKKTISKAKQNLAYKKVLNIYDI